MDEKLNEYKALDYGMRWGIEAMLSDFKTRGFGLKSTMIRKETPGRVENKSGHDTIPSSEKRSEDVMDEFELPRDLRDEERTAALDAARVAYEAKGYTFTRYPVDDMLPDALHGTEPDAIAVRPGRSIIIDVTATAARIPGKRGAIFGPFADATPGWEFHPIVVPT